MNRSKRILLVDDDKEIVEAMKEVFVSRGYQVSIAGDGKQGIKSARQGDVDLMILDMMMPKKSGFLVLEELQQDGKLPIPVIMITANEGRRHRLLAEMLGVFDYLRKPFAMEKLIETADRAITTNA